MIVARFWAQAQQTWKTQTPRQQVTLKRWGWSNVSQEDAQRVADERLEQAWVAYQQREKTPSFWKTFQLREPKVSYNGADGVPIREEIIEERDTGVVTRNSYGALCLNTEHVMILDFDEDHITWNTRQRGQWWVFQIFFTILVPFLFMAEPSWASWMKGALLAGVGSSIIRTIAWNFYLLMQGGLVGLLRTRLAKTYPALQWRVYETPKGVRMIETSTIHDPSSRLTQELMQNMQVDPLYTQMCKRQRCFRARVSPKPWRIGLDRLKKGQAWPLTGEALIERERWVMRYDIVRESHAACRYIQGPMPSQPALLELVEWHDRMATQEGKPIA